MNESLVKAIKSTMSSLSKTFNELQKEYEMVKKMEPKNIQAQNEIAIKAQGVYKEYNTAKAELTRYEKVYNNYVNLCGAQSIESDKEKSKELEKAVSDEYDALVKLEDALAEKYDVTIEREVKPEAEEEEEEYTSEKPKKGTAKKVIAGVLAFAAAVGIGYGLRGCTDTRMANNNTAIVDTTTQEQKEPGEYGTFLDVTDNEQVNARANYLYNTYFEQFRSKLTPTEQAMITPEKIANIIRVANGELPLDSEGNRYYDANLTDDYIQALTKITADLPSSPALDKIYSVPTHLFAVDGSDLSNFMMKYDEDYANIAEARNNRDGAKAQRAIASLGKKLWYEWSLQGMNYETDGKMSDYKSPFDLPAAQRALALNASVAKYGPYVFEYNLNAMQPVCIDACVDYYSKTMKQLTVNEIFVGVTSGEYDTVIAKAAGIEVDKEPDSIAFDQDLRDQLEFKYRELKQMTLK